MESSLEPPASAFASHQHGGTVPVTQLQHLLGMAQPSDRPPMPQSGFSSALGSKTDESPPRPKSVRFGDEVGAAEEAEPQRKTSASMEEPTEEDFENAQVSRPLKCSHL
jgi:hypothetical protein